MVPKQNLIGGSGATLRATRKLAACFVQCMSQFWSVQVDFTPIHLASKLLEQTTKWRRVRPSALAHALRARKKDTLTTPFFG